MRILLVLLILGGLYSVKPEVAISDSLSVQELQAFEESMRQEALQKAEEEKRIFRESLMAKAKTLEGKRGGQCVIFAKSFLGVQGSWGWARNVKTNSKTPEVGAVMVTNQSKWGHVQIVLTEPDSNNGIWVIDSNYKFDGKIRIRYVLLHKTPVIGYKI